MDDIAASLETISLVCTTIVFIRDVTKDSKTSAEHSKKLHGLLTFLEVFSDIAFTDVTGLLRDTRLHPALIQDVEYSLYSLNKALAAHREAWRYVGVGSRSGSMSSQRHIEDMTSPTLDVQYERQRWRDDMRERSQIWRERAKPGLYGALFGRDEMNKLVGVCQTFINRLRQTLEVILLLLGPPTPEFRQSREAVILGVKEILERQRRAQMQPSGDYNAQTGTLRDTISATPPPKGLVKTVYKDENGEVDVFVEARPEVETPTELLCHLTWLIQNPTQDLTPGPNDGYLLYTLTCMGFLDDPVNNRGLILYKSPQGHPWASNPPSLHNLISNSLAPKKLTLRNRFRAAAALASTVLETHASGWVHRNICSHNLVMVPRTLNETELTPHLVGWSVPRHPDTSMFDLETNIYQHKDRFGKPLAEYQNEHDVYSLGVVLLELGLWKTMSVIFAKRLLKAPKFDVRQQDTIYGRTNTALVEFASSKELKREMGERYSEIVLNCLTWHPRDPVEGMIEFRNQIVDGLAKGCDL